MFLFAFGNIVYSFANINLQYEMTICENKFAFLNFVDYICILLDSIL